METATHWLHSDYTLTTHRQHTDFLQTTHWLHTDYTTTTHWLHTVYTPPPYWLHKWITHLCSVCLLSPRTVFTAQVFLSTGNSLCVCSPLGCGEECREGWGSRVHLCFQNVQALLGSEMDLSAASWEWPLIPLGLSSTSNKPERSVNGCIKCLFNLLSGGPSPGVVIERMWAECVLEGLTAIVMHSASRLCTGETPVAASTRCCKIDGS